jgi:hypothetical protein
MLRYLGLLIAVIAMFSVVESLGVEVSPGAVGIAAGAATTIWLSRRKRTSA